MRTDSAVNVFLALGSNVGDREKNIREAIGRLNDKFKVANLACSPLINTSAIGFCGNDFINCIAVWKLDSDPLDILHVCKDVEKEMGRSDKPEYGADGGRIYHDRIIDIDILLAGEIEMDTPELTIPHPQLYTRPYIAELLLNLRDFR